MKWRWRYLHWLAWCACAALWLEHFAILSVFYRELPTQFWQPIYCLDWALLFLPCLAATLGVYLAYDGKALIIQGVVAALLCLHISLAWVNAAAGVLGPVEPLPPGAAIPDRVTYGIPIYAIGVTGLWIMALFACFLGRPLAEAASRWFLEPDDYLPRDFREPAPK